MGERIKFGLAAVKARGKKLGRQKGHRPKSDRLAPKVMKLIQEGRSYRWIARDLGISKNTVLDIAFLDRTISLGMDAQNAQEIFKRRGFAQIETWAAPKRRYDECSQTFIELPLSDIDIVKQNIRFVELKWIPNGQLECFARSYARFIASGDRLICWTKNSDNKIIWRQAGWRGAML